MEPEALGRLLDRHAAALTLFARQLCDAPEDVVQEAFLRMSVLERAPENPGAWLFRVVRNLALDASLAAGRRRKHEAKAAAKAVAWFEDARLQGPDSVDPAEAERVLAGLPREEREVIVAHLWGGLTFEQIAESSGTSSSTAHRLYVRGLESMRERLGVPCLNRKKPI
ncbi:RNA polymerase sigma factor [Paludisphaera mucosa]|uniref:Sigma-70 family RNA polymerase sigma factor n=1 Tax=Paludisphaera mucosa TaxID=3030827 RepID=A0ABT6F6G1_9BACT|nr:sigma-70 family RNA polymerase sigma factor [Paludisphaera mucosa]MDG3003155.1 sigma-70 family RNA polymerase sigma factor [Paludisphaera mucosa]